MRLFFQVRQAPRGFGLAGIRVKPSAIRLVNKGPGRFLLFFIKPERYAKGDIRGKLSVFRVGVGGWVSVG